MQEHGPRMKRESFLDVLSMRQLITAFKVRVVVVLFMVL